MMPRTLHSPPRSASSRSTGLTPRAPRITLWAGALALTLQACGGGGAPREAVPSPRDASMPADGGGIEALDAATSPADAGVADASAPDASAPDARASDAFSLTVRTARGGAVVERGASARFDLVVVRDEGFTEALAIAIEGLPDGVTATLPAGVEEMTAPFELVAAPTAPVGEHTLTIRAFSASAAAETKLDIVIPGDPGKIDAFFGNSGILDVGETNLVLFARELTEGKLLVGSLPYSGAGIQVTRYLRDGTVDAEYGEGGTRSVLFRSSQDLHHRALGGVSVEPDGRAVIGLAATVDGVGSGWLVAIDANGDVDPAFGVDGIITAAGYLCSFVPRGALLVLLTRVGASAEEFSGELVGLDPAHPETAAFRTPLPDFVPYTLAGDGNGIYAAGLRHARAQICRFDDAGAPSTTFGGGCVSHETPGSHYTALTLLSDATIVAAGTIWTPAGWRLLAGRLDASGNEVTAFGNHAGWMEYSQDGAFYALTRTEDDEIFASGRLGAQGFLVAELTHGGAMAPELPPTGPEEAAGLLTAYDVSPASGRRVLVTSQSNGRGRVLRLWR